MKLKGVDLLTEIMEKIMHLRNQLWADPEMDGYGDMLNTFLVEAVEEDGHLLPYEQIHIDMEGWGYNTIVRKKGK